MRDRDRACNSNCSFVADPYHIVLAKMLPKKRRRDAFVPTVTSPMESVNNLESSEDVDDVGSGLCSVFV